MQYIHNEHKPLFSNGLFAVVGLMGMVFLYDTLYSTNSLCLFKSVTKNC